MPTFNQLNSNNDSDIEITSSNTYSSSVNQSSILTKVFGVMFVSLLLTAVVSYGIAYLLTTLVSDYDTLVDALFVTMIVSIIGSLTMAFVLPSTLAKGKHSILPAYIIYCLFISGMISSLFILFDLDIIIITFGVTALCFGIMGLLGYVSKGSMKGASLLVSGMIIGILVLSIINLILRSSSIGWFVSFGILAVMLFVTMMDVRNIKQIINNGSNNSNIVLYCSFELYLDFINIFLRLLPYIARIYSKK